MATKQPETPFVPEIRHYPVTSPGGRTEHQVILVISAPDEETGAVRGFPLGYVHQAGHFLPDQFADD